MSTDPYDQQPSEYSAGDDGQANPSRKPHGSRSRAIKRPGLGGDDAQALGPAKRPRKQARRKRAGKKGGSGFLGLSWMQGGRSSAKRSGAASRKAKGAPQPDQTPEQDAWSEEPSGEATPREATPSLTAVDPVVPLDQQADLSEVGNTPDMRLAATDGEGPRRERPTRRVRREPGSGLPRRVRRQHSAEAQRDADFQRDEETRPHLTAVEPASMEPPISEETSGFEASYGAEPQEPSSDGPSLAAYGTENPEMRFDDAQLGRTDEGQDQGQDEFAHQDGPRQDGEPDQAAYGQAYGQDTDAHDASPPENGADKDFETGTLTSLHDHGRGEADWAGAAGTERLSEADSSSSQAVSPEMSPVVARGAISAVDGDERATLDETAQDGLGTPLRLRAADDATRDGRRAPPKRGAAKGRRKKAPAKRKKVRKVPPLEGQSEAKAQGTIRDRMGRPLSMLRNIIDAPEGGDVSFRAPMRRGFFVILLTFGLFGSWAVFAQIDSAVIAPGSITVSGRSKEIQHLEGGIIREILVRDGDFVDVGTPLIRLDGTRETAQFSISQRRFEEALANVARLVAERDKLPAISFPPELLSRQNTDAEVRTLIATQQQAFETRRNLHEGQISLLQQRIEQLRAEISGLQAQEAANGRRESLLGEQIRGLRELLRDGFAPRNQVSTLERELAEIQAERAGTLARIAQAEQGVTETNLRITQEISTYRETVLDELKEWERQQFEAGNEANMMADTLERTVLTAPVSGTVVGLSVNTEGAVIAPGEVLMEIVPDRDALIVEVRLQPQDIDSVTVDQRADVQLSAFSQREVGKIAGTVTYVSADRRDDERTGMPYFLAQVELDSEAPELQDLTLTPGMPAEAFINTGSRTPFKYLVGPLTDSFGRAWRES